MCKIFFSLFLQGIHVSVSEFGIDSNNSKGPLQSKQNKWLQT